MDVFTQRFKRLQSIVDSTPYARQIIEILASLGKNKAINDLRRIQKKIDQKFQVKPPMYSMETVYEAFERAGWGTLYKLRGQGANPRFEWSIDYRDLANKAIAAGVLETEAQVFTFRLSTDKVLHLNLDEIVELQGFIKNVS